MQKLSLHEITKMVQENQPFRISVTKETSTKIQKAIFAGGGKWITQKTKSTQTPQDISTPNMFIYFDNDEGGLYLYTCYKSRAYNYIPQFELKQPFTRDDRYIVLKRKDISKYLSSNEQHQLDDIVDTINNKRLNDGKALLSCVVVESDWPEYEKVWDMLETRVIEESKIRSLPEFMEALTSGKTLVDEFNNEYKIHGSNLFINNKPSSYCSGSVVDLNILSTRTFTELR